jgi:phospholipase/lecithinase/hemolysin
MEQVALSGDDVHYLDTASMLDRVSSRAFIDSNHLTRTGHHMMAKTVSAELTRLGWW